MKHWSPENKNKLLLAGTLVMLVLVYAVSVRPTLALHGENELLQKEIELAHNAPGKLEYYRAELQRQRRFLDFSGQERNIKEDILEVAASGCEANNVLFKNLSEPSSFTEENLEIETYEVSLQGDFIGSLKTIAYMEEKLSSGKIVSTRFRMEKNRDGQFLVSTIFIQTSKTW
jgi:hypothetical protein